MSTVMDQARPWLTPSSTLAATIHPHEGASMIMNGTGTPTTQPAPSTFFLPTRSARVPDTRLEHALTIPKETMNEKIAVFSTRPNCWEPIRGTTVQAHHPAHEGVDNHQQRELAQVLLESEPDHGSMPPIHAGAPESALSQEWEH